MGLELGLASCSTVVARQWMADAWRTEKRWHWIEEQTEVDWELVEVENPSGSVVPFWGMKEVKTADCWNFLNLPHFKRINKLGFLLHRLHLLLTVSFKLCLRHDFDVWPFGAGPGRFTTTRSVIIWLTVSGLCFHPQFLLKRSSSR